jgi:carbonic anhydrase
VAGIKPAAVRALAEQSSDPLDAAVRYNVVNVVTDLGKDPALGGAMSSGALRIVGARYDLDTGAVEFL